MKMTSAYANKLLKSLADEKSYWTNKEEASRTYVAAVGEEPVIPEYDYSAVSDTLNEIDRKTVIIRHALNLANATAKIPIGDTEMSVDSILVKMAQLNYRKTTLDTMRKCLPKMRESSHSFSSRNAVIMNASPVRSWKCRLPLTSTIRRSCLKWSSKEFFRTGSLKMQMGLLTFSGMDCFVIFYPLYLSVHGKVIRQIIEVNHPL